jgi:hypothetical protein
MKPNSFNILKILLGVIGAGLLTATAAVFLPVEWMAHVHHWLGLGEFPNRPITIYLARSTSLLYAVHGFLMLYTAIHLRQYLPLAKIFGYLHVVIGLTMLGIDLTAPMPLYWIAGEGIPIAITGAALVWLASKATAETSD